MNTAELMTIQDKSKPFFALRILTASLRRDVLMITFFGFSIKFYPMARLNMTRMNINIF